MGSRRGQFDLVVTSVKVHVKSSTAVGYSRRQVVGAAVLRAVRRSRQRTASGVRIALLRSEFPGFRTEGRVYLGPGCDVDLAPGSTVTLRGCSLLGNITLVTGPGASIDMAASVVGRGSVIAARERITIGTDSKLAEMVVVRDANHDRPLTDGAFVTGPISIGREVWLGAKSTILAGVVVGDEATIGAGAVVTRDVPPGSTALGVPARVSEVVDSRRSTRR